MAMPDNVLSTTPIPAAFIGAAVGPITRTLDLEDGGVALNDPSLGQEYQIWKAVVRDEKIYVSAPNTPEFLFQEGVAITDVSLAFDQNMRLHVAWIDEDAFYWRWFDTATGQTETTNFGTGYLTPKCTLDDKRSTQSGGSDIILAYVKADGKLYHRRQRDRFGVEYLLSDGPFFGISKLGMNAGWRLQFLMVSEND